MRQVNSGEWVRDQHVVRQTWREAPWCLEDASHVRLPVIQSRLARRLHLELAGAAPDSCSSMEFCLPCAYCICRYLGLLCCYVPMGFTSSQVQGTSHRIPDSGSAWWTTLASNLRRVATWEQWLNYFK